MNHLSVLFLIISLVLCDNVSAQVYTWINADGSREYGDEPPANAQKAELPQLQTMPTKKKEKPTEKEKALPKKDTNAFTGYNLLNILTPKQDEMILASKAGNASVQLHVQPPLQPGHEVSLLLDGKEVQKGPQLYFELNNIFRGSHLVQAKIKHQGKLLISSPKRRIHVQRPSILNR